MPRTAQFVLDFARQPLRLFDAPLGQQTGMHHDMAFGHVQQRQRAHPVDEIIAIGRLEHGIERVVATQAAIAVGKCDQVQIVIAQYRHGVPAKALHEAQRLQRPRSPVDQITDEPEAVAAFVEADYFQKRAKLGIAALNVADCVSSHEMRVRTRPIFVPVSRFYRLWLSRRRY